MRTVQIALIGFGTIGSGIAEVLEKQRMRIAARTGIRYEIASILDTRDFSLHPMREKFVHSIDDIIRDESVSVVAEAIGGVEPAYSYVMRCIQAKKHVVTSNKELVAEKGAEILDAAARNGVGFLFEAAVGGAMPIIGPMLGTLAANRIDRIDGILNGTTNYILTNMQKNGTEFAVALEDAQRKGYAETPDPSADIDGIDAQRKIAILASLAYGVSLPPSAVRTEGIGSVTHKDLVLANAAGGTIKLIASASGKDFSMAQASVAPTFVGNESRFASVEGVYNMVLLRCEPAGAIEVYGKGAGKTATAGAVLSDIIELTAKTSCKPPFFSRMMKDISAPPDEEGRYLIVAETANEDIYRRLINELEIAAQHEQSVCFFTATLKRADLDILLKKLEGQGVASKAFPVFAAQPDASGSKV